MELESYPRSAKRYSALNPPIRAIACVQSAVVPCVMKALSGMPCASTARCSFVLAPFCAAHGLIAALCARSMRVHLAMTGINHQPLIARLVNQHFKKLFPYSVVSPPNKAAMGIAPAAKVWWQSCQGAPVRITQKTASMKRLIFWAIPPQLP